MIILRNALLQFGERILFDHINLHITLNQKIGVVGRNGAGKSTLLEIISGHQQLDEGEVVTDRKKNIAYFPQHIVLESTKSVFEETYSVFHTYIEAKKRISVIEQELESSPIHAEQLLEEYSHLLDHLKQFDEISARKRTNEVLNGLGFGDMQKNNLVSTLSVGWKMRVVFAKLLLINADFYLFDEPTNHLDLSTKEWFCDFLQNASFGFLLVTHDRYFLEKACSKILEIENGKCKIYEGNFNSYITQKEQQRAITEAAYKSQQKEIESKERTIERFRAKATKATLVKSMIKQLDRIERIEIEPPLPKVRINFPVTVQPGKTILTIKNVSYQFPSGEKYHSNKPFDKLRANGKNKDPFVVSGFRVGEENVSNHTTLYKKIFDHASDTIVRGQKVALVAPNGTGKTTLFNLITGKYPIQSGEIIFGHNVKTAFFEQEQSAILNPSNSIFQEVANAVSDVREETIRMLLGSFLFSGDDINKKIGVLSGGEKNRVAMVKVLLQKANFLLLDEPTNHLDLITKEILLQALQQYQGTILFVSHDHTFIQNLATDILELTPDRLHHFPGNYEAFLTYKKTQTPASVTEMHLQTIKSNSTSREPANQNKFELRKKIAKIEKNIERLEREQKNSNDTLTDLVFGTSEYKKQLAILEQITNELTLQTNEWERLQNKLILE